MSGEVVRQRIEDNLTNHKPINRSKSYSRIIFENVFNFCNTITLFLVAILIAVGQPNQTVSSSIILLNIAIGIYQEIKAKWTVEKLSLVVDSTCEVLRDGVVSSVSTKEIVLDDLFYLTAGLQVPVDGVIVDGIIELDESILTGESEIIKKSANNAVLAGSHIVAGKALVRADRVGKDCYIENVARIARRVAKPRSNIFRVLDRIIKGITVALIPLALLLYISTRVVAQASLPATITQVAGAILGMLPIGMFLLTSTALASSVLKLAKKNTLAQDLYSVEMLAMVDTLLLDKTGTITDGKLKVIEEKALTQEDIDLNAIITTIVEATHDRNPTALALKEHYHGGKQLNFVDVMPFSSGRKMSAVEIEGNVVYCLGAPDFVVEPCDELTSYLQSSCQICRRSLVLGIFNGSLAQLNKKDTKALYAFSLEDKLRDDVKDTLDWFYENGVDIKIVSGDNPRTVSEIAQLTGVKNAESYVNCSELTDAELEARVTDTAIFGRVAPEQKSKIVNFLQNKGRIVGMVGDGVNDVQALKEADCSISFASANEVARNISRIVMLDSNFKALPNVVSEGRRVISNVEKVSALYIMKNLFVMFMTLLFSIVAFVVKVDLYPFIPTRMLLIELFVIGIPTFALALQSNNKRVEGNFLTNIMKSCVPAAMSLITGVGLVLILLFTNTIDLSGIGVPVADYRSSIAVITFTMSGFSALYIIALPRNKFRLAVIIVSFTLSIGGLFLDQLLLGGWFLEINLITDAMHILWVAVGTALATVSHIFYRWAVKSIDERWGDSIRERAAGIKNIFKRIKSAK